MVENVVVGGDVERDREEEAGTAKDTTYNSVKISSEGLELGIEGPLWPRRGHLGGVGDDQAGIEGSEGQKMR